ncbi:MAG: hypothetical protein WC451_03190 [Patescibacteria group bacterium]|jgi:hypothetical protein
MSSNTLPNERMKASNLFTAKPSGAYTAQVGAQNYMDLVVEYIDPAANATCTIPDGKFQGQEIIVSLSSNDNSKTITVGYNATSAALTAAGDVVLLKWCGADWQLLVDITT